MISLYQVLNKPHLTSASSLSISHCTKTIATLDTMNGASVETGGVWDPLGFARDEDSLYKYRAVELKHGRVAMLATVGVLAAAHRAPLPPDQDFTFYARPQAAVHDLFFSHPAPFAMVFLAIGAVELFVLKQDPEKAALDLGFGVYPKTEEELEVLQLKELKMAA
jgi:light-harvesting complex I chlorophyll a/b binding protein 1